MASFVNPPNITSAIKPTQRFIDLRHYQIWIAQSWWSRMRGLLGYPALSRQQGLLIKPCSMVHTMGMQYPIDVVFLSETWQVIGCQSMLMPKRYAMSWGASLTLELAAGEIEFAGIKKGQFLLLPLNLDTR